MSSPMWITGCSVQWLDRFIWGWYECQAGAWGIVCLDCCVRVGGNKCGKRMSLGHGFSLSKWTITRRLEFWISWKRYVTSEIRLTILYGPVHGQCILSHEAPLGNATIPDHLLGTVFHASSGHRTPFGGPICDASAHVPVGRLSLLEVDCMCRW